uniref:Prospero domain-containing protein n=1 Tax=Neogobius melanostomus TaxID=47308 RepID=A0A8C6TXR2_9GOBI
MASYADFFDKTPQKINLPTVPSCCVHLPALHCQQTQRHPLIQDLQTSPRQIIQMNISFQTHPEKMLEAKHKANENKDTTNTDTEGGISDKHKLVVKNKLGDFDQKKSPPMKKMRAENKSKNEEFEHWGRKKRKDEMELKEFCRKKCGRHSMRIREKKMTEKKRTEGYTLTKSLMQMYQKITKSNRDCDEEAKFVQFLKIELGSAVARVIDRVLGLYTEAPEFASSSPPAAFSFLDETNEKWGCGVLKKIYKGAQRVDDKDGENTRGQSIEPSKPADVQMSEGVSGKLLPQYPLPTVCLSKPPLLAPPSRPSASPCAIPSPHYLQSMGPLPLLHLNMQELFSRTLSQQLLQPTKGFHLNTGPPLLPPVPLIGLQEPRKSEARVEVGMRGTGCTMDLYFTSGISFENGLSPCHLKKAKLLFFYTRYPSSSALKTYFSDVKFNRCVTSQMIKWFSNFREFFYIQMERFARQAVQEALTLRLRVDDSTELYRILNMHYNKSNVYQVPDGFIKVSEVALREFYAAIWTGRDCDPCWKKGIYKIICKLDSPVPDAFLLPGCPVGMG